MASMVDVAASGEKLFWSFLAHFDIVYFLIKPAH